MTTRPIRLLVSREHAEQILSWYDDLPAATNTNEDAALAASIERAIESHDEEMERREASEVSVIREVCDHWVGVKGSGHYRYGSTTPPAYWTHTYCPKCGEKL